MLASKPTLHCQCVVCCQPFFSEQCIEYTAVSAGGVQAKIVTTQKVQGYAGVMQGGLVTALHDSAMLHCLFNLGIVAMTASLEVRFHQPVPVGRELCVQANLVKQSRRVYCLQSQISCNGMLCSSASSRFMAMKNGQ